MRAITAVGMLALAACAGPGTDAPGPPTAAERTEQAGSAPTAAPAEPTAPQGFDLVAARITDAAGEVCDLCAWVADTADLRARGLMGVTSLEPGDAMAFVYPAPTTSWFWMKDTVLPLSIAFFDASGAFLDSFDMAPCHTVVCPNYPTPPHFTFALEAPQGALAELLVGPGSTLTLFDRPCAPAERG